MPSKKISALPPANALTGTEMLPTVQDGETRRTTANALQTYLFSNLPSNSFVHVQGSADTTWTVVHNLGFKPSVTVVDSADTVQIEGGVEHLSNDSVRLTFSAAFSGKAYLS